MADTGWKSPGTCATIDTDAPFWWTPDNVKLSNNSYSTAFCTADGMITDTLRCTNFNMGVPVDATIDGIIVSIEKRVLVSHQIVDNTIILRKTAGQVGDNKADTITYWTEADTYVEHGGVADDWNAGLTVVDVNHADFGVDIQAEQDGAGFYNANIDHVRIKVYYTEGVAEQYSGRGIGRGIGRGVIR